MNKNYDYKRLTPFKWFVLQNFPFIDEDFDAITNYQLFCKLGEEINKLIESMNLAGQQVEDLTNFVNNYFDNLDVQEEINTKLDEMVEDGTLQEIVASYLNSKAVFGFDTVQDMKNATNFVDGSYAQTLGFYSKNDDGGALYKIRKITNNDVIDESTIIEITGDVSDDLIAELVYDKQNINPAQFGAKLDGETDDTQLIQKCLSLGNVKFPSDSNVFIKNLEMVGYREIDFNNSHIYTDGTAIICGSPEADQYTRNFDIKNGRFINEEDGTSTNINNIISCYQCIRSRITNCSINFVKNYTNGIYIENCFNMTISEVYVGNANQSRTSNSCGILVHCTTPSIEGTNNLTNNIIENGLIQNVEKGIYLKKTDGSIDTFKIDNIGVSNASQGVVLDGPSGSVKNIMLSNSRVENSSQGIVNNGQLTIENIILNKCTNQGINNSTTGRMIALGILQYVSTGSPITGLYNAGRFDASNVIVGYDNNIQVSNIFPIEKRMRIQGSHSGNDFSSFISPFDNFTINQTDAYTKSDLPTSGVPNGTELRIMYNGQLKTYYCWNNTWNES